MRKLAIILAAIFSSFLLGSPAFACTCDVPSFEALIRTSPTSPITHIFAGRIISITNATPSNVGRAYIVTFSVVKNWGRAKDSIVTIYQGESSCDRVIHNFVNSSLIIFFAGYRGGVPAGSGLGFIGTNSCLPFRVATASDFPAISRQFDSLDALPKLMYVSVQETQGAELAVFPNPSTNQTTVRYSLAKSSAVTIELLNSLGQVQFNIATHSFKSAGLHEEPIVLEGLTHGIYFCRISTSDGVSTHKLVVNR
jgi:hypothetical protein